ncbi:MAG: hypothetical protein HFJ54_08365 [Clostridia bacterium]|nr:hypothetical protein [Clostridia bacterium]
MKNKIIILISIIVIGLSIFGIYELMQYNISINTVLAVDIENKYIYVEGHKFSAKDSIIIDFTGNKVDASEIKIGNKIKYLYKKDKIKSAITPLPLHNVKIIKIIDEGTEA